MKTEMFLLGLFKNCSQKVEAHHQEICLPVHIASNSWAWAFDWILQELQLMAVSQVATLLF